MKEFNDIWDTYRTCWSDKNTLQRIEKLKTILTDDFEYKDPEFEVHGYKELSNYMLQFQEQFGDASFITKDISQHHNRCLINWAMVNTSNEVLSNGTSFVIYENNQIKQITGFFNESTSDEY